MGSFNDLCDKPYMCACGKCHVCKIHKIWLGAGALRQIAEATASYASILLVADDNTYRVAGAEVEKALTDAGFSVVACVIHREHDMLPDDLSCGEVLLSITRETEFLIAVGSGSVTDTTRIKAERTGLPFVYVGTAPSMDGYASAVAPLLHRGLKIQRPAVCPEIIVCDLDVLATAPMRLIASGVGDVLGKYIAKADWQLGQVINGEPCCPVCVEMVTNAVNALVDNVEEIAHKTEKGMRILIEALLLSGLFASLGGAFMSMGYLSYFARDMMAGRGYIGIAAATLADGHCLSTLLASLGFGTANAASITLATMNLKADLVAMIPYLVTVIGLVIVSARKQAKARKLQADT